MSESHCETGTSVPLTSHFLLTPKNKKGLQKEGNMSWLDRSLDPLHYHRVVPLAHNRAWCCVPWLLKLLQTSWRFRLHWRQKSIFVVVFVHALNVFKGVCLYIHRCSKRDLEFLTWKFWRWFLISIWTVHCQRKTLVNVSKWSQTCINQCSQTDLTDMEEYSCDQWICAARPIPSCLTPYGAIPLKSNAHRNCTSQENGKVLCPRYHPINSGSADDGHIRLWSEEVKEA